MTRPALGFGDEVPWFAWRMLRAMATREREVTAPTELTRPDGSLDPRAVGYARRPLFTARLPGPWGRRKRWDYWCVTTDELALQLTVADLDYLGLVEVSVVDLVRSRVASCPWVTPLGVGVRLGPAVGDGFDVRTPLSRVSSVTTPGGVRLRVRARTPRGLVEADVLVRDGGDSLDVVVPWSAREFQLTSKHVARPAEGTARAFGRSHDVSPARAGFGCLDFGRGVWPRDTVWNWGAGAGHTRDGRLGLQLGGKWTDGTGATENGVFLDGRLEKLGDELDWGYDRRDLRRPWTVKGEAVDLVFTPRVERSSRIELGVGRSELHLFFGTWRGRVEAHGRELTIDGLGGWAEEHRARW